MDRNGKQSDITTPRYYQPTPRPNDLLPSAHQQHQTSTSSTTNPNSRGTQRNPDDMKGKTIRLGQMLAIVKDCLECNGEKLFALEAQKSVLGYDGTCPKCNTCHVQLSKTRGFYASVNSVLDALEQQKIEKQRSGRHIKFEELDRVQENLPPLASPITGKFKGIEGESNSCYIDSTIFCMFAYSDVFDSLLHMKTESEPVKDLQKLLRENIVNVLRSNHGYVESDALYHLRNQLNLATNDPSFKEMEKDPSEFLRALEQLFHYTPLKTVHPDQPPNPAKLNVTTNIIWEMFDINAHGLPYTSIASIFRNSLAEVPAKLMAIPRVLILVAPRHSRAQRCYRYVIPDRQIVMDHNILQLICVKCKKTNHEKTSHHDFVSCERCLAKEDESIINAAVNSESILCYCTTCLSNIHDGIPEAKPNHRVNQIRLEKHKLNLFAVLCIETSHYVAFVKCKGADNQKNQWLFFDSMSDRVSNLKNVSCVETVENFEEWITEAERNGKLFEALDERRKDTRPSSQKFSDDEMRKLRLFRDGAFFFYENSSVNYQ